MPPLRQHMCTHKVMKAAARKAQWVCAVPEPPAKRRGKSSSHLPRALFCLISRRRNHCPTVACVAAAAAQIPFGSEGELKKLSPHSAFVLCGLLSGNRDISDTYYPVDAQLWGLCIGRYRSTMTCANATLKSELHYCVQDRPPTCNSIRISCRARYTFVVHGVSDG